MTDVARKRALERRDLIPATFWIRIAVAAIFGLALLWRIVNGAQVVIRDGGALFGIAALRPAPIPEFLIYLTIDVLLITVVMWLYFRALQISPLSMCGPFLSPCTGDCSRKAGLLRRGPSSVKRAAATCCWSR